jgi:hypothetical protein
VHRPGAHFDVERLLQQTATSRPEFRELEDKLLKRHAIRQLYLLASVA